MGLPIVERHIDLPGTQIFDPHQNKQLLQDPVRYPRPKLITLIRIIVGAIGQPGPENGAGPFCAPHRVLMRIRS
jgi:hypothetical protein